jgi:hypothetical protein
MEGDWWTGAYLGFSINGGAPISGNLQLEMVGMARIDGES